jgi:hypothetical protein
MNAYVQSGATNVFRYIYGAEFAGAFQMIPAARSLNAAVTLIMQVCKISRTWEPTIRQNVSLIHANIFA